MNQRRAGAGFTRPLATLLALAFPLTAIPALAAPTAAAAAEAPASSADGASPPAASEAEAFALARTSGKRVEIIDRRTEYSETYATPDGSLAQRQFTLPAWTRQDATWRKTDPTVTTHEDGSLGPTAAFGITFSRGGDGPLVAMEKGGKKLALTWPGRLPEPVVGGNTALYKSVLPGVDLKLIAEVNGFAEHLIVNTPEAAANPALKAIKLGITTDGVTLDDDATDKLIAKDASGQVVFSAPRPEMWEQPVAKAAEPTAPAKSARAMSAMTLKSTSAVKVEAPEPQHAPVAADVTGSTLTLTPDAALLASATQFPLVIDPVFTGGNREKWAVVYSATPDADYPNGAGWRSDNPADEPRVGYNGTGDTQSFFNMNISGLQGATVGNVTFAVEQTHSWGCDAGAAGPTELWTARDISTTPTWRNRNSYLTAKIAQGNFAHGNPTFCPGVEGYDFTSSALTSYVQDGANHGWNQLAFALRVPDSYLGNKNSYKRLRNNPVLEFTYNFKPEVTGSAAFEGTWTPAGFGNKAVPCGSTIGNSGLALTAVLKDKDGGTVTPEFVVTTATGTAVPVSNVTKVASGGTATATVLAKNLTNGTYRWKVRAKDGEGPDSPYTGDCAFTVDKIGPTSPVTVTREDGTALTTHQARTKLRLKVKNPAGDLAGFCWAMDHPVAIHGDRCFDSNWVPVTAGTKDAILEVVPTGSPESRLHVLAFDQAGNHSPVDGDVDTTILKTTQASYVYPAGKNPLNGEAKDLLGDLNGDGHTDMLATDTDTRLLFYPGDGTGQFQSTTLAGMGGWGGALLAHGGDFSNFLSPTAAPDGYEDILARLSNNKLYLYPGNGQGGAWYWARREIAPPSDLGDPATAGNGWGRIRQVVMPGDMDQRTDAGFANGSDMLTLECIDEQCSNARLRLYPGRTVEGGGANQATPFQVQSGTNIIGAGGWHNYTIMAPGDLNGDGIKDLLARNKVDGNLYLYPGQFTNGVYGLGTRTVYGTGGWQPGFRPLITSSGNAQGTVLNKTFDDDGTLIPYREYQPKTGDERGDLWATTPADANYTIHYDDGTGTTASTTCPTGCLLFYPGGATTHRQPLKAGNGGWHSSITSLS
ncbi:FG-GAP repeat domain-containing protein [Streptomyces sp. NPDC059382]|uniref:FG-GAP repeat domain-containing protein n=1 Tax=Streptomyces sp. NPDC059382 TaxID=3346816 RepID=UPI0036C359C4